jgi:hypothetical protein
MLALALQKEKKTQKDWINTNVKTSRDQQWKYKLHENNDNEKKHEGQQQ